MNLVPVLNSGDLEYSEVQEGGIANQAGRKSPQRNDDGQYNV